MAWQGLKKCGKSLTKSASTTRAMSSPNTNSATTGIHKDIKMTKTVSALYDTI